MEKFIKYNNFEGLDINALYEYISVSNDIDTVLNFLEKIKSNNKSLFDIYIERLKILFALSDSYNFLSTCSLVFSEFKIHSSVHLIVAKLLSGKFDDSGGTFLFSLIPLRKHNVIDELRSLWSREISWEMKQKLLIMNISPPENSSFVTTAKD